MGVIGAGPTVSEDASAGQDRTQASGAGLETGTLPLGAVIAQSVGGMGVSSIVALLVPLVAITAGAGGWLAWTICTVLIVGVACCISALARRVTTTGGIYGLAAASLGPLGAIVTGWTVLILIGIGTLGTAIGFGIYFSQFLGVLGLGDHTLLLEGSYFLAVAFGWFTTYTGVKRSARVMLGVEVVTITAILVLLVAVLVSHRGSPFDHRQLSLHGTSLHKIVLAAVFGVLAFGGFESATVFGREARNPRRAIPLAMLSSVVMAGLLWIFASYVMFMGFEGSHLSLATSTAPLHSLARIAGIGWFGDVTDFAISITLLAAMTALFNGVSRLMFTASEEGIAPRRWSRLHPRYRTPASALNLLLGIATAVMAAVVITNTAAEKAFDDSGDLVGLAFLFVYILMCVGVVVFLRRRRELRAWHLAVGLLSGAGLLYVFYRNLIPWPSGADGVINGIELVVIGAVFLGFLAVRRWRPGRLARIGSTANDA
jgi:amino acid transporter